MRVVKFLFNNARFAHFLYGFAFGLVISIWITTLKEESRLHRPSAVADQEAEKVVTLLNENSNTNGPIGGGLELVPPNDDIFEEPGPQKVRFHNKVHGKLKRGEHFYFLLFRNRNFAIDEETYQDILLDYGG